jgi:hypothetical protein
VASTELVSYRTEASDDLACLGGHLAKGRLVGKLVSWLLGEEGVCSVHDGVENGRRVGRLSVKVENNACDALYETFEVAERLWAVVGFERSE